jgi:hypothetical protein
VSYVIILVVVVILMAVYTLVVKPRFNKAKLERGETSLAGGGALWEMALSVMDSDLADSTRFPDISDMPGKMAHALGSMSGWSTGKVSFTATDLKWSTTGGKGFVNGGSHGGSFSIPWSDVTSVTFNNGPIPIQYRGNRLTSMTIALSTGSEISAAFGGGLSPMTKSAVATAINQVAPGKAQS